MANMNEIMMVSGGNLKASLTEKKLIQATNKIEKYMDSAKKSLFGVAVTLAQVDSGKWWEKDGFKNVSDYAEKVLGYKKAMTNNLIRIANQYLDATQMQTILEHPEKKDWTVGQLQELLVITPDEAKELVADKKIDVTMSTKKIRDAVKAYRNKAEEVTEEVVEEEESTTEEPTPEVEGEVVDGNYEAAHTRAMALLQELYDQMADRNESENVETIKEIMASVEMMYDTKI